MTDATEVVEEEKTPIQFYKKLVDSEVPKKKIILSFMKEYGVNTRTARSLYRRFSPKRKRHPSKHT